MRFRFVSPLLLALVMAACSGENSQASSSAAAPNEIGMDTQAGAVAEAMPGAAVAPADASDPMSGPGLLARVKTAYAALTSYADTATISTEQALPGVSDTLKASHSFSTKFTGPRQFKFDFRGGEGDRYVIWSSGDSFFTWWKSTGVTEEYPKGQGATAFATAQQPTSGGALMIAPLLFQDAGLVGPLSSMESPEFVGEEMLDGRATYKIRDDVRLNHWSAGTRPTTVWIDAETLLVRKVVEEKPSDTDLTDVIITTIKPEANPQIPSSDYTFTPPKS